VNAPGLVKRWVLAARVRTLPAAAVPVALGAACVRPHSIAWLNTLLCLVIALALQVGVNYANDYSDGVRGTDEVRVGPFRLTASKLVAASVVKRAAFVAFALAGVAGLWLAARTSWWLVPVGVSAVAAAWFYTGGKHPYGYYGFGEFFVMVYFGFVATVGTAFAQHSEFVLRSWWWGLGAGAMACALLEANNLRDVTGDRASNKKTLAARLGRRRGAFLYDAFVALLVVGLIGALWRHWLAFAVAVAVVACGFWPARRLAHSSAEGRELLPLLKITARAQLLVGAAGCVLSLAVGH
jgi:1,4-dihydroxy-2-naphthoate octaprenyltransferase